VESLDLRPSSQYILESVMPIRVLKMMRVAFIGIEKLNIKKPADRTEIGFETLVETLLHRKDSIT
jgi:hypothetical protein